MVKPQFYGFKQRQGGIMNGSNVFQLKAFKQMRNSYRGWNLRNYSHIKLFHLQVH